MSLKDKDAKRIESLADEIREISLAVRFDSLILLSYAAEVVNRYLGSKIRKHGQDQTRMNILYLLVGSGGSMTPTNISKRVNRSKHAITRAIDILEKDNLVKREHSRNDRRSINIIITNQGIDLVKRSLPDLKRATSVATSCLNKKQIDELKTITSKLRKWLLSSMSPD
jgi:DNA-binding MarR family transcriptional regulator